MFSDATGLGGKMGRHAWLVSAMADMATYAQLNGLITLHQQLCHVLATAATGELADTRPLDTHGGHEHLGANVVLFDRSRRQSS